MITYLALVIALPKRVLFHLKIGENRWKLVGHVKWKKLKLKQK